MGEEQKQPQAPGTEPKAQGPEPQAPSAAPQINPAEVPREIQQQPQQVAQPTQVFVPKKTEAEEARPGKWQRFKAFLVECQRVLRVTKKPDKTEYATIVKISGIGMVIIGVIGFLIHFAKELLF